MKNRVIQRFRKPSRKTLGKHVLKQYRSWKVSWEEIRRTKKQLGAVLAITRPRETVEDLL